jgi:transforming growth factor-beta-induced protein
MKLQKLHRYLLLLFVPIISITLLTACSDDDNGTSIVDPPQEDDPNLVELAQSDDNFSTLVSLVVDLDLVDVLSNNELTVFAPTNAAFDALPDGVVESLTAEQLTEIVTYHLVEGTVMSSDLAPQQDVVMVQGERTLIQSSAAGVLINGSANVITADLTATNGVIHAIDQVILPTEFRVAVEGPSLVEVAQEAGNFETLLSLTETVGLTTTLQFLGPYTAFAPTDEAFEELFAEVDPGTLSNEEITFVLTYHVLFGEVPSSALDAQQAVETINEELLYITAGDEGVTVNGTSSVIAADVEATNGVIHVVDSVLLPNAFLNIPGLVQKNYNLTTLLGLVAERPDILEALSDPNGSFTVFAPTNEAFEDALAAFPDLTEEQITEILTYHVIAGATVLSTDLEDGASVETLQGEDITVNLNDGVQINNANVVAADIAGTNGVVHVIDAVILPPSYTE